MTRLFFTGRGSSRWQDVANWSLESGGRSAGVRPSERYELILDEQSGVGRVDLTGCPHGGLSVSGFRGSVTMPDGSALNFGGGSRGGRFAGLRARRRRAAYWWAWNRPRWRRRPRLAAAVPRRWRPAVASGVAVLHVRSSGWSVVPVLRGAADRFIPQFLSDLVDWVSTYLPKTGSGATYLVAASNASARVKAQADYVCDGTADDVEINAALTAGGTAGAKILLSAGVFKLAAPVVIPYDGTVFEGYGTGHPNGVASTNYATGAVSSGTRIQVDTAGFSFPNGYAIDCRVTGNVVTTLNGALSGGETTITLTSTAGMPNSGTVVIQPAGGGGGIAVTYTGKSGSTLTGCSGVLACSNGAQVNYGARTLAGVVLRNFSLYGFGTGSPYADASGIFFQNFRGAIDNVKVVYWKQNGITVDGGGSAAISHLGAFDNKLNLYIEGCGGDALQLVAGASDNILYSSVMYGLHPTLGRYLVYIQDSPGLIINGSHFAYATDHALYGDPRSLKIDNSTRFTDCAKGGVYLIGTSTGGGGFDIRASFRDCATGNAGLYDDVNIAPTSDIRGGYIDTVHNVLDDANAPRYLVNIANSHMIGCTIGPLPRGYVAPATKAFVTAVISDSGTSTSYVDVATGTHAAASKTTPVDADEMPLVDSAASFALKKLTWANLKATLKAYFDTLYATTASVDFTFYRMILSSSGQATTSAASGSKYWFAPGATDSSSPAPGSATDRNMPKLLLTAADLAVSGKTTKLRVVVIEDNAGAPGVTITVGLYPVNAGSTITLGTVVPGSTVTFATPGANSVNSGNSGDFTLPADGVYALGYTVSGTPTNGFTLYGVVQARNV